MSCIGSVHIDKQFAHIAGRHPCFSGGANMNRGRIHLPVSPACNIRCRFCKRSLCARFFNRSEDRPGVSAELVRPSEAADLVRRALELCPEISVAGIAGPGDTLATGHALETFGIIHREFPGLINCLSTNGLLLERFTEELDRAGVRTITVTVNAVDPVILDKICAGISLDGTEYKGTEGAEILIEAQKRGIQKAAAAGMMIKINIVLIPGINDGHTGEIARTVAENGAALVNIIPLIPQSEFEGWPAPDCEELRRAREAAEEWLPVFRHCRHCRADACGIPGRGDLSSLLYGERQFAETFSHG
jgi:nitrogen fixation protein NifB